MTNEVDTPKPRRVTAPWIQRARQDERRITMLTAYDTPSAILADSAGVDAILVGDSIGRNVLGYPDELNVSMDDMVRATRAVAAGVQRAFIIADMPFGSYQCARHDAVTNAIQLIKAGANAVKFEGAGRSLPLVKRLVSFGIPVVGHLGFTPQSTNLLGGAKVQGRTRVEAQTILDDARALQTAGVFCIVLELIPSPLAATITNSLIVPTIGIGSGPHCDGQVQIWHDVLGIAPGKPFRHVKRYADLATIIRDAINAYVLDVQSGQFPSMEHAVSMDMKELSGLDSDEVFPKSSEEPGGGFE